MEPDELFCARAGREASSTAQARKRREIRIKAAFHAKSLIGHFYYRLIG
jgi:hypothetical protein